VGAVIPSLSSAWADEVGPGCEPISHGFLREPVSTYSSLAFVVAAVVIVLLGRRRRRSLERAPGPVEAREPSSTAYAVLVAGIGLGSVVQHGPNPFWADLARDLPLAATLIFIIADSVADLAGRSRVWWWWALPTALLAPVIHFFPQPGDMAQGAVSVVTVLLGVYRAYRRPALRRPIIWTVALLATGGILEILSSPGWPLCDPETRWWYGHAVWHAFVAAGLAALAPALGWRQVRDGGPAASGEGPRVRWGSSTGIVHDVPSITWTATTRVLACDGSARTMRVTEVLRRKGGSVVTIAPEESVRELLALLAEHQVGAVVVSGDGARVAGIVSERDIVRRMHADGDGILDGPVSEIMTVDVRFCGPQDQIDELMDVMTESRIRHLPVLVEGRLAGIVSIGDVVKHRMAEVQGERDHLTAYITR